MTKKQFLLLKLSEECAEVAQRCSKQIQFGRDEKQKDQDKTNGERLKGELLDLISIWALLEQMGEVPHFSEDEIDLAIENKKIKLQKYLKLSNDLGQLPEITL
jgi:hypothetical protein